MEQQEAADAWRGLLWITLPDPVKEESLGTGPSVRMSSWPYLVISTCLTREEAAMQAQFSSPEDITKEQSVVGKTLSSC